MVRLMLLCLCISVSAAWAQSAPQSSIDIFNWRASGSLEIGAIYNGQNVTFKCSLREDGDSSECASGKYHAKLNSYRLFVSVILTKDGEDQGQLFLLERQNKDFAQMNDDAIVGRAVEMPKDLQYSLERFAALQKLDGKDPSFCFRTMVSYFEKNPSKKLDAFADDVEKGVDMVKSVPKPSSRVAADAPGPAAPVQPQPQQPAQPRQSRPPPGQRPMSPDDYYYGGGDPRYARQTQPGYGRDPNAYPYNNGRQYRQQQQPTFNSPFGNWFQ
jgi:hypothetical protein